MNHSKTLWLLLFIFSCFGLPAFSKPLKVVVVSDLNSSLGSTTYGSQVHRGLGHALSRSPDLIIGTGDYVAGEDISHKYPLSRFDEMWAAFKSFILDRILETGVEFAPSPGNHDASGYPVMQRERAKYLEFWDRNTPRIEYVDQRNYPWYYSYMLDNVFFISMDDVTPFRLNHDDDQRNWIREQLNSPEAQSARARIVYGHVPIYPLLEKSKYANKGKGKYYEVLNREQWEENSQGLEKLLLDANVDLAVFGHSHTFFPGKVIHRREGKDHTLRILSMPCLGSGSRYLSGQSRRSPTGFATIDISDSGSMEIQGYDDDGELISRQSLPERIIVPGQFNRYYRDDQSWE